MKDDDEHDARDTQWLIQMTSGGAAAKSAWKGLYTAYQLKFLRSMVGRGLPVAVAEEALQVVWMDVLRKAAEYRPGSPPSRWLWGYVNIAVMDAKRKLARAGRDVSSNDEAITDEIESAHADAVERPDMSTARAQVRRCVREAFAAFKRRHPDEAALLYARHLHDWSLEDVAAERDSTTHAAAEFLCNARRLFRPMVKRCLLMRLD